MSFGPPPPLQVIFYIDIMLSNQKTWKSLASDEHVVQNSTSHTE